MVLTKASATIPSRGSPATCCARTLIRWSRSNFSSAGTQRGADRRSTNPKWQPLSTRLRGPSSSAAALAATVEHGMTIDNIIRLAELQEDGELPPAAEDAIALLFAERYVDMLCFVDDWSR